MQRPLAIVLLALLGVACAAGITYAASTLVSQPVGLESESEDVGRALAPVSAAPTRTTTRRDDARPAHDTATTAPDDTAPPPDDTAPTAPTITGGSGGESDDDHGGERDRDGDDD